MQVVILYKYVGVVCKSAEKKNGTNIVEQNINFDYLNFYVQESQGWFPHKHGQFATKEKTKV